MDIKKKQRIKKNISQTKAHPYDSKWYIIVILIISAIVFINAITNDFVNWDDNDYVTDNLYIRDFSWHGFKTLFTVYVSKHYHPLTLLSYTFDYRIWGLNPMGYIFMNILFHLLNVFIVYKIFLKISKHKEIALITALLFAIHPMRVESVVWISARKDVLFAFFYLLSVYQYIYYLRNPKQIGILLSVLGFYIFSLLSKGTAVSLPMVLLLLDYYFQRKDYTKIFLEKIPFLALSITFAYIAILAQSNEPQNLHPFKHHFFLATYALSFYVIKFFTPLYQSCLFEYPKKTNDFLPTIYYLSSLIIPITLLCIYYFKSIRKQLIFAILFFGFTIGSFLIKFPIGPFYLAERYTYVPYIGIAFLVSHLICKSKKHPIGKLLKIGISIWIIFLIGKTFTYIKVWSNSETLWTYVLKMNSTSAIANNNLGNEKIKHGDFENALVNFNRAIEFNPNYKEAYNNRGSAYAHMNLYEKALKDFEKVIYIDSTFADAHNNMANALSVLSDFQKALLYYDKALFYDSLNPKYYYNRAHHYVKINDFDKAIRDYNNAIKIKPDYVLALDGRAKAKLNLTLYHEAIQDYNKLLLMHPNYCIAYNNQGFAYQLMGDLKNAETFYLKAINCNSNEILPHENLAMLYHNQNEFQKAIDSYTKAISINPDKAINYHNRAIVFFNSKQTKEACKDWEKAISLGYSEALNNYNSLCHEY